MAAPTLSIPARTIKWEARDFTIPGGDLWALCHTRPVQLRKQFLDLPRNTEDPVIFDKMKSCLTNVLVHYLNEGEGKIFSAEYRKRLLEEFKRSSQWQSQIPETKGHPRSTYLGALSKPPINAPRAPLATRATGNTLGHPKPDYGMARQAGGGQKRDHPSTSRHSYRAGFSRDPSMWRMPGAPSSPLADMTFWRFLESFREANGLKHLDIASTGIPWDAILKHFINYIQVHWPENPESVNLRHVSTAIQKTKLREYIPQSILEKHGRLLAVLSVEGKNRDNQAPEHKPNSPRDQPKETEPEKKLDVAIPLQGGLDLESGPPHRSGGPATKRPRESEEAGEAGPPNSKRLRDDSHALGQSGSQTAPDHEGAPEAGASLPKIKQEEEPTALNALASVETGVVEKQKRISGSLRDTDSNTAAKKLSPAPSATSWLHANIPDGLNNLRLATQSLAPVEQSDVGDAPNPIPVVASPNGQEKATSIPGSGPAPTPAFVSKENPYKMSIRVETILQGGLEELEALLSNSDEVSSKPLTAEQRYTVGHIIKAQRKALQELSLLQTSISDV